jgi:hypothetical protein
MDDIIRVQVIFTVATKYGDFRDALYFTEEDYAKLDPEILAKLKKERVDAFIYRIENPPAVIEPTKEMLEQEAVGLRTQIASMTAQLATVDQEIADKAQGEYDGYSDLAG